MTTTADSAPGHENADRIRVVLVFGGVSSEHSISCLTAASVASAIDTRRYEVTGLGITPGGRWTPYTLDEIRAFTVVDGVLPSLADDRPDAVLVHTAEGVFVAGLDGEAHVGGPRPVDVAMPVLHGPFGEDGTVQGYFEMLGLRYTGAGVAASAIGMDKQMMKLVLAGSGLPIGGFTTILPGQWEADREACRAAVADLGLPVYVKPARGGSSVGISRVDSLDELDAAVVEARRWDPKVIVETGFVGAREIECAVLGDLDGSGPRTSRVGEIRMHTDSGFYDFGAKYLPEEQVTLDVPATIAPGLEQRVREVAARTFTAVAAEGLGRVDVFVTADGEVVVNEINTMPGFTRYSMFPMLWQASGMSYPEVIDDLITQALRRPVGLR